MSRSLSSFLAFFLLTPGLGFLLDAQTRLTVAAASDLSAVEAQITPAFQRADPGVELNWVNGASTMLAQQISHGAPFNVFLSANVELVDQLKLESARVYAVGHVAMLWRDGKRHPLTDLANASVKFIAIPNPRLAPYGTAAEKLLKAANLWDRVKAKFVYGENVRQTLELFDSGNADVVLTSESLIVKRNPERLQSEVIQKGGIVPGSGQNKAARKFLDWLTGAEAQGILAGFGFSRP